MYIGEVSDVPDENYIRGWPGRQGSDMRPAVSRAFWTAGERSASRPRLDIGWGDGNQAGADNLTGRYAHSDGTRLEVIGM